MEHDIRDISLADEGEKRIEWADNEMQVLSLIRERFEKEHPLEGVTIGACLHVTTETANLVRTLKAGGAKIALCASNPLSTQDDVAAALVKNYEIPVFAFKREPDDVYYQHIDAVLDREPVLTLDDGADLVSTIHDQRKEMADRMVGGMEETTTGVIRLRSMAEEGVLLFPIIAVNDADSKHLFDNRYGTGQSTLAGIMTATNVLLAGRTVVVAGYGWCGRGIAARAAGMGANVIVTEVQPMRALEAVMDGFRVMPMGEAAKRGELFVTVTGNKGVIRGEHFENMKDGAIIANSGHFNVELQLEDLESLALERRQISPVVEEFSLSDGRRLYLLAEGRLVNLAAAQGHPAAVMDMSFANQALTAEYMITQGKTLDPGVYPVPTDIDQQVARLKLETSGIAIDELTEEQSRYLSSWKEGT